MPEKVLVAAGLEGDGGAAGKMQAAAFRVGEDFADAHGGKFREGPLPGGFEAGAVFRGDGEKQFEILAVAKGVVQGLFGFARGAGEGDGGGLEAHENAGGHLIERHVGKSEQWLKESLGKLGYDDPGDLFCVEWTPSQGFYVTPKNGDAASDDAAGETVVSN